jgi:hypothetical protein
MRLAISMAVLVFMLSGAAFGQPNDNCGNATVLNIGATPLIINGTTVGATTDGSCGCDGGLVAPDVWYSVTPTQDRVLTVSLCETVGSFDTVLSVHTGCPGTANNQIACNDDACGVFSSVAVSVTANQTYLIRVTGFRGQSGAFTLSATLAPPPPPPTAGPDVFVGDMTDVECFGRLGEIAAYAVGTDACNLGDVPVNWLAGNNQHPVIAQNMFRYTPAPTPSGGGRFEQVGESWLKHAFASTNDTFCGQCAVPPGGSTQLGVGCSDAYDSGLNGDQALLGPRSEVNATTGAYPVPHGTPTGTTLIDGRLQVKFSDVDPALNVGAQYFVDAHYVTADDATWTGGGRHGDGLNNCTWRKIDMSNPLAIFIHFAGNAARFEPGIDAWQAVDPTVTISNADYEDGAITARFVVGGKVSPNADGTFNYEYAVYNINSDRSGGSFSVPLPAGAVVSNIGFHGVFSHSGEPFENTAANPADWRATVTSNAITWTPTHTFAQNVNANALRWGTMYNFRFTSNAPPQPLGTTTIGLFKPATAASPAASVAAAVPVPLVLTCESVDFNNDGDAGTDADIEAFFACLAGNCCSTCGTADFNRDGDAGTDLDIEAFFRVLAGGTC